jgi:DNA-binding response OmpR family regulator
MAHVLILEKDAAIADAWRRTLAEAGHDVTVTQDGRSGLELLDSAAPELAITEIILPHIGGVAFTGMAKLRNPSLKVIAVTGDPAALDHTVGALALAGRVGADLVLEKPIAPDELVAVVNRLLADG